MKLDSRIKSIDDIQTILHYDVDCIGSKGYFFDEFVQTTDLSKCRYGELVDIITDNHDLCFKAELKNKNTIYFRFFLPESDLKPVEKKYRVLTLNEFLERFKIGDAIYIRFKKDGAERVVIFSEYNIPPHKDEGNNTESVCLNGIEHHLKSIVCLGMREYNLTTLFDCYEYFDGKEWQPFGVIDE